jgi:hypothetical protein
MAIMGNIRKRNRVAKFGVDLSITAETQQPTIEGAPCKRCTSTIRFKSDGRCVRCLRQWRRENEPRYYKKYGSSLFRKLGLTVADYYVLCEGQDWRCLICGEIPVNLLHVDHCHETNKIRGLLCGACNVGLGHFRDSPERLKNAIAYLANCK